MHIVKLMGYIFLSCFFCACQKNSEQPVVTKPGEGVVRPIGEPIGGSVEKSIGAGGGTLISDDGKLKVEIPAGALTSDVTISIEPITRTLVDGVGNATIPAYRIKPHGQQFLKPITISFDFSGEEAGHLQLSTARIAYQKEDGKWVGLNSTQTNSTTGTLSVKTTHFSDWTVYETVFLEPTEDISLEVKKSVTLKVMTVTLLSLLPDTPVTEENYLDEPSEIPASVDWRIVNSSGGGKLVPVPTRPVAIFTAPSTVPNPNPVLVEAKVDLKTHGQVLLLKNIFITEAIKPGIHLKINGGDWIHFNDTESFVSNESYVGSEGDFPYDRHAIYIRIAGGKAKGTGSWPWKDEEFGANSTSFEYIVKKPAPRTVYEHRYTNNDFDIWHTSAGGIRITEYKEDEFGDTWATGDFTIERSTPYIEGVTGTPPSVKIYGNFKLRVE